MFTRFQVFNTPVLPGTKLQGTTILNKSVTQRPDITLRYNQNVFSIAFSSLGLGMSVRNKFQYKLEGFNNEWLSTDGGRRTLTFTNIDPGKYRLRVRHEGDSDPGQEAYLQINILPPFWKTTPAYFLYLGLGIILLLLGRRLTIRRANIRFQMALQKRESERVHELDMLKLKFFTNVSHEFRTPISLILSPVEQLLKHTEDNALKRQYQLIYRNARRLLGLVNQLLDFRKLEKNELRLYPTVGNIVSFVKEITLSFTDLAEKKNIDYHFHASAEDIQTS
ncbi:MAG: hybrid sensor histidine kinase/response regulator, partial [Chitinophagaceae bacterium]|nr:hybrid sensor histidine kinase/response regulator [Chitinophagaceae bacterium]